MAPPPENQTATLTGRGQEPERWPCVSRETPTPPPASPEMASAPHATVSARGVWERDGAYPCIVRVGDLRVIECKDAIQWIWQRRRRSGSWADLGYFRNRDVLIERSGLDCPELRALPPYHLGREVERKCAMLERLSSAQKLREGK